MKSLIFILFPLYVFAQQQDSSMFVATGTASFTWKTPSQVKGYLSLSNISGTWADSTRTSLWNAINGKQASGSYVTQSTTVNGHTLSGNVTVTASDVSLGNVTNESKATMFTNAAFTGTFAVAAGSIANAALANSAVANLSGTNTGDQTTVSGNAGTATTLETARKINGVSFNGSADIQTDLTIAAYLAGGSPWLAQTMDIPFISANTSTALVDNTVRFVPIYLPKAATLTGIRVYVRTLGNYTGDNNNRVGLYSYSGGTMTLVASSTNSASLWTSAANAFQTIPFTSTYAANAGLYFVGLLYNQSAQTTAPTLAGAIAFNNVAMVTYQGTNSIKFFGTLGSSNDLPSSQAMTGVTGVTASYWVALY